MPIGGGGRYDGLLSRFGRPLPATGLALDVDALGWALRLAGADLLRPPRRFIVVDNEQAPKMAAGLRGLGIPATVLPEADADAYARAWGYAGVLRVDAATIDATLAEIARPLSQVYLPTERGPGPPSGEKE